MRARRCRSASGVGDAALEENVVWRASATCARGWRRCRHAPSAPEAPARTYHKHGHPLGRCLSRQAVCLLCRRYQGLHQARRRTRVERHRCVSFIALIGLRRGVRPPSGGSAIPCLPGHARSPAGQTDRVAVAMASKICARFRCAMASCGACALPFPRARDPACPCRGSRSTPPVYRRSAGAHFTCRARSLFEGQPRPRTAFLRAER